MPTPSTPLSFLSGSTHSHLLRPFAAALLLCGLAACRQPAPVPQPPTEPKTPTSSEMPTAPSDLATNDNPITEATAKIEPLNNSGVRGTVTFREQNGQILVIADLEGLTPGEHGIHIHEHGDCSAPDGSSAGGHYNPTNQPHGAPSDAQRHMGDLGNISAGPDGKGHYEYLDAVVSLKGEHSILNRSVIVHSAPDDFKSQPAGNSGDRIAGGVILPAGQ